MVHIPFLGIDVPEPRIAEIVPDVVEGTLRLCTKALDATQRVTHPLPPEVHEALVEDVLDSYPREIKKVLLRGGQGKHKNEDQLSSELEEAAYGFYRRMIRTSAVGDTEEDQEDVTAYKLGLDRPSASKAVRELYEIEQAEAAQAGPSSGLAMQDDERLAMQVAMTSASASDAGAVPPAVLPGSLSNLRGKVRRQRAQGTSSALNAGLGVALAVAIVRGVSAVACQMAKLRKPKAKKGAKKVRTSVKTSKSWELPPVVGGTAGTKSKPSTAAPARPRTTRKR